MAKMNKPSANSPCPCGSGRKYKKCCGATSSDAQPVLRKAAPQEVARMVAARRQVELKESIRRAQFGEINPAVYCKWETQGKTLVGVGNGVCIGDFKSFPDFLDQYLRMLLTNEWLIEETERPAQERHPIAVWFRGMVEVQIRKGYKKDEEAIFRPNGSTMCYILLAYDLYALRHHGVLQKKLLKRLMSKGDFQGARYELFAAASMIRAGFDIDFEDETDASRKHPEFVAKHRATGVRIAVEAKSKHRCGILGYRKTQISEKEYRLNVERLIKQALDKKPDYPYLIFVDVNMPPSEGLMSGRPWFSDLRQTIERTNAPPGQHDDFNAILFTNFPQHYDESLNPAPAGDCVTVLARNPSHALSDSLMLRHIHEAVAKHGVIPRTFDEAS